MQRLKIEDMIIRGEYHHLREVERQEFVALCASDFSAFKKCIDLLIYQYQIILFNDPYLAIENRLISESTKLIEQCKSNNLYLAVKSLSEINEDVIKINFIMQDAMAKFSPDAANSVYTSIRFQYESIRKDLLEVMAITKKTENDFSLLLERSENLLKLFSHFSVSTILKILALFMEALLELSCTKLPANFYNDANYLATIKTLVDFSYHENCRVNDETDEGQIQLAKDNLITLSLIYLSDKNEEARLESACYTSLLTKILNINLDHQAGKYISHLDDFMICNPANFIKLYRYLFQERHIFSDYIHQLLAANHLYAAYNCADMAYYASVAYRLLAKNESVSDKKLIYEGQARQLEVTAKNYLLLCYRNGLTLAHDLMSTHFAKDRLFSVEFLLVSFEIKDDRRLQMSADIYPWIKNFVELSAGFLPTSFFKLFQYWSADDLLSVEMREFAGKQISHSETDSLLRKSKANFDPSHDSASPLQGAIRFYEHHDRLVRDSRTEPRPAERLSDKKK